MRLTTELDVPGDAANVDPVRLNEKISRALSAAIATGEYPVGTSLPTEATLCATFGASRFTVRQALRKLSGLGLIETRQGAGSKVVSRSARAGYEHVFKDLQDIFEYARGTHLEVTEMKLATLGEAEARYVRAPPGSRWLRIVGVRRETDEGRAFGYVNVFVHARFAPLLEGVQSGSEAIYGLVEARSGEKIAEAIQEISALDMPDPAAKALGQRRGTLALKFVRRYCDESGSTMLTSVNWHPAERFTYTMRIKRGQWAA